MAATQELHGILTDLARQIKKAQNASGEEAIIHPFDPWASRQEDLRTEDPMESVSNQH